MGLQPEPVSHGSRHSGHVDSKLQLMYPCHITHFTREGNGALRHDVNLLKPPIQSVVESALTTGQEGSVHKTRFQDSRGSGPDEMWGKQS